MREWVEADKDASAYFDRYLPPGVEGVTASALVPETGNAPKPMKTYTVVPGDSLKKIALEHLGSGKAYAGIIAANPGKRKDRDSVVRTGDVLVIPES